MTDPAGGVAGGDQPTDEAIEARPVEKIRADLALIAVWDAGSIEDWSDDLDDARDRLMRDVPSLLAAVGRVRADDEASSVLQLLIDNGVKSKQAYGLVEPIRRWFDGMSPGLAEAFLPSLYSALVAVLPGVRADTPTGTVSLEVYETTRKLAGEENQRLSAERDLWITRHNQEVAWAKTEKDRITEALRVLRDERDAAVAAAAEARAEADKRVNDAWEAARAAVERQTDLTELVHFERPSDFRKGVLSSLVALDEARKEVGQ